MAEKAQDTAFNLADIFNESFGREVYDAFKTHDWSGVADSLASTLSSYLSSALGGLGPFGGFLGGILGGFLGDALGGLFGGKKKKRGDTPSEPIYTSDVNTQALLTQLLNATKINLAKSAAAGMAGRYGPSEFQREAALIGAS
ncbi:MAG TPA: hypothetical protein VLH56_19240 [Dissulfurispiraceae bacterium]|nr:hypothetical protein [Dissulfurispiraceae bacterium]